MKYLRYLLILVTKLIGKIIGVPMFYILLPLRHKARHIVYNYVLQNNIYLPRLLERGYKLNDKKDRYYPQKISHKKFNLKSLAYINYENISSLRYYIWLCVWVWFDDDSNYDTHDGVETNETIDKPFGNTFDLGDLRGQYPIFDMKKTFYWICRNSFYNFNYMFEEIRENSKYNFYIKLPKLGIHFGYIPYSNLTRKGRMVWFREDLDKIDKDNND